jgi:quercetin dioxygenase-like cupin family protein
MQFHKAGSRPTRRGPADYFTGNVLVDPVIETPQPARLGCARVAFEPGARTAWHTHPLGQTIYIVAGVGRVQLEGGPVREIKAGDVVYFGPNEKHWHGAAPETSMVHIAMQEALDGKFVTWMEHVTDADYRIAPAS